VSDIDTAVVDCLKVLDPNRPIREATGTRTCREVLSCHKLPYAPQQLASLFDYFVGAGDERGGHGNPQSFGGLEVDHQLKFGRL
jgi:hypothetical protein